MSQNQVSASEAHQQLMKAIGDTIAQFTTKTPMSHESIVGILSFCLGAAIGQGSSRVERLRLRKLADSSCDYGTQAVTGSSGRLILPEGYH